MNQTNKLPAVPSAVSRSPRKPNPRKRPRVRGVKAGPPCPAGARPAPWDPEPIFHSLIDELHFNPQAVL